MLRSSLFFAGLFLLQACSSSLNSVSPQPSASPAAVQAMVLKFAGAVNGQPFACGQKYSGVGSGQSQISPRDFRFYVSNVHLINTQGQAVPLSLEQDGKWQTQNVALLDFEDKVGGCDGTAETRFEIKGTVPAGSYKGLKFELGVPFELNHQDVNMAPSPLNLTSLFWVWRWGYKFARFDLISTGQPTGWFLHLGSTGCTGPTPTASASAEMPVKHDMAAAPTANGGTEMLSPPTSCAQPNRASVSLPAFEAQKNTIVADLGRLLADSNLDQNQADSPVGCMSGADDGDCAGIFKNVGLPFGNHPAGQQTFFSLR